MIRKANGRIRSLFMFLRLRLSDGWFRAVFVDGIMMVVVFDLVFGWSFVMGACLGDWFDLFAFI